MIGREQMVQQQQQTPDRLQTTLSRTKQVSQFNMKIQLDPIVTFWKQTFIAIFVISKGLIMKQVCNWLLICKF